MYIVSIPKNIPTNKPFYYDKRFNPKIIGMDTESALSYLRRSEFVKSGSYYKFTIFSGAYAKWKGFLSARTVITAIKNGHTDIDIWQHSNPIGVTYHKDKKDKNFYTYSVSGGRLNFTIDIDSHKYINNIEDLKIYILDRGLQLPFLISHSSRSGFHAVYRGFGNEWDYDNKIKYLARFCGINDPIKDYHQFREILSKNGIDPAYLNNYKNHPEHDKFRIQGSINSKRVDEYGRAWVVSTWYNDDYSNEQLIPEIRFQIVRNIKNHINQFWTELQRPIEKVLKINRVARLEHIPGLAKVLSDNITMLKHGMLYISSNRLAMSMGVNQTTASEWLRRCVSCGIITVIEDYSYDPMNTESRKPRLYGAGELINNILNDIYPVNTGPSYDCTIPFKVGETQDHLCNDIRYLYKNGISKEDIVEFLYIKEIESKKYPGYHRYRTKNDIYRLVDNWFNKSYISQAYKPQINIGDKTDEFRSKISV
jgi:hypothetical protein